MNLQRSHQALLRIPVSFLLICLLVTGRPATGLSFEAESDTVGDRPPAEPVYGPAAAGPWPDSPCQARLNDEPTVYTTVQAAVDASSDPGDVVKVAGYCTGVEGRPAPPGYSGPAVITQVVYISQSLTLQGGYTFTNWTAPDPLAHPTTLDAQGEGRVLVIAGDIRVTVAGLRVTGGAPPYLGGGQWGEDAGRGILLWCRAAAVR